MRAALDGLSVVGDNVANARTPGYKEQRVGFEALLGRSVLGGAAQSAPGAGARMGAPQQVFSQGPLQATGHAHDVALNGDGFFVVRGTVAGLTGDFYTRAGQVHVNDAGALVTTEGLALQGWPAVRAPGARAAVQSLSVPSHAMPPRATSSVRVVANLDATAATPLAPWDVRDAGSTANYATSVDVFDSLGARRTLDLHFRKVGAGTWEWHAAVDGADVGGAVGEAVEVGSGRLTFTTDGNLAAVAVTTPLVVDFTGAAPGQALNLDFGAPGTTATPQGSCTQLAGHFGIALQTQDGMPPGELTDFRIDPSGLVSASYSNGETAPLGTLAVARFRSNAGLERVGNGLWAATRESGAAALGSGSSGGRATIAQGAIEASNVELSSELVELVVYQSAFAANARVMTTARALGEALREIGSAR